MIRNFFADLELEVGASLTEVRVAFKRLAKKFHPDLHPEDPVSEESFKRIKEAYEHLNSTTKIQKLKNRLSTIRALENSSITKWKEPARLREIVPIRKKDDPITKSKRAENLDIHLSLQVSDRVIQKGGHERFQFVYEKPCPTCQGRGGSRKSVATTCKKCSGLGTYMISRGALRWKKTCEDCFGKGVQVLLPCTHCSGKGKISEHQSVEINIPEGVDLNQQVPLKNLGHVSFDGNKRGDLWLTLSKK